MESHRRGRFSGVDAIETPYGNLENNVDDNRMTSDNKSLPCPERSMFQFDLGKNQPPNKRAKNSNPPFPDLLASKEEEQVGTMRQQNEDRMSEAICLLPGYGNRMISNGSNLKTRLCNKWELTRWCPFGDKCHFAHGSAELRGYDGQLLKTEAGNSSACDVKQTTLPYRAAGIPLRNGMQKEDMPTRRWKGPNKISKIYGDWIDDF